MRRYIALAMIVGLLAAMLTGCSQAKDEAGSGDGLHLTVPDLVGMTAAEAAREIERAGYEVGEISPEGGDGEVIEQQPPAGYSAPRGGEVDITVSQ